MFQSELTKYHLILSCRNSFLEPKFSSTLNSWETLRNCKGQADMNEVFGIQVTTPI